MTTFFSKLTNVFAVPARRLVRPTTFRPRIESLHERLCLSVSVSTIDSGHTLVITGDNLANNIQIIQNDDSNVLTVTAPGVNKTFDSDDITKVVINLQGGADTLTYTMGNGSDFENAKNIILQGGVGHDTATFDFHSNGNTEIEAPLSVTVNDLGFFDADKVNITLGKVNDVDVLVKTRLGFGNDTFNGTLKGDLQDDADVKFDLVDVNNFLLVFRGGNDSYKVTANDDVDIDEDASLDVAIFGAAGNDLLEFAFRGEVDGLLKVRLDGGAGFDTVKANITLDDGSDGTLDARLLGGANADALTFNLIDDSDSGFVIAAAIADGGSGIDTFSGTANVTKVNI